MNFDSQSAPAIQPSQTNQNSNLGQSLLGGLLQSIGDSAIEYGSRYLEQELNSATQNM